MSRQLAGFFAIACVGLLVVLVVLPPEPKGTDRRSGVRLTVGDAAPPFPPVQWLADVPPTPFEPGKVTVVEVWATWCGPCLQAMPHLAELKRLHAAEGLVVVPVCSANDDRLEDVEDYAGRNRGLGLPFAFCPGLEIARDYMAAAGEGGFPTSFVVDRRGNIAFIGHPMELDAVLPEILARR